jgi:hypothetical protein
MCKQYGVEILISGYMRILAGDAFLARRVDRVVAYGRRGTTDIYELVATQGTARPEQVYLNNVTVIQLSVATFIDQNLGICSQTDHKLKTNLC